MLIRLSVFVFLRVDLSDTHKTKDRHAERAFDTKTQATMLRRLEIKSKQMLGAVTAAAAAGILLLLPLSCNR